VRQVFVLLEAVLKLQIYKPAARASESSHCQIYSLAFRACIEKFAGTVLGPLLVDVQKLVAVQ